MPDHRSSDSRIPEWAVIPFWSGVLIVAAALTFMLVSIGVHYLSV